MAAALDLMHTVLDHLERAGGIRGLTRNALGCLGGGAALDAHTEDSPVRGLLSPAVATPRKAEGVQGARPPRRSRNPTPPRFLSPTEGGTPHAYGREAAYRIEVTPGEDGVRVTPLRRSKRTGRPPAAHRPPGVIGAGVCNVEAAPGVRVEM